jgi:hypothetical protein
MSNCNKVILILKQICENTSIRCKFYSCGPKKIHWDRITGTWSSLETGSLLVQQINKHN